MGESRLAKAKIGIREGFVVVFVCVFSNWCWAIEPDVEVPDTSNRAVQENTQKDARANYALGQEAYRQKEYVEAEAYFKRAYQLKPHPIALKMIAECRLGQGDILSAVALMENVLQDDKYSYKDKLLKRVKRLRRRLTPADVERLPLVDIRALVAPLGDGAPMTDSDVESTVGGVNSDENSTVPEAAGESLPEYISVQPDDAKPNAAAEGESDQNREDNAPEMLPSTSDPVSVSSEMGDRLNGETDSSSAVIPPAQLGEKSEELPSAFWAASAVAGIGVVSGTVFGTMALRDEKDYRDSANRSTRDSGRRAAVIADISFGLALGAAVVGTVVLILEKKRKRSISRQSRPNLSAFPMLTSRGAGLSAGISFD